MPEMDMDQINQLVEQKINEALSRRGGMPFTMEQADTLDALQAQMQGMMADRSMGRIINGASWIDGTSIENGTVTAGKIQVNTLESIISSTGALNVTGDITAAAAFPATGARVVLNSSGLTAYNSTGATKTVQIKADGSGEIGTGVTKLSWSTTGTLTVPAAAIGSLTIADVGTGTFNADFNTGTGKVKTGSTTNRVELSSSGLKAFNNAGTETFSLSSTDGNLTATGNFSLRNAATGARVEVSNVGIRGFNSSGTQTFNIQSSDGSVGFGVAVGGITPFFLSSTGTVAINGSTLAANSVESSSIKELNAGKIISGSVTSANITISSSGRLTLGSGGKIVDSTGSEWSDSGITLKSSGSFGDTIKWQVGSTNVGSIYGKTGGMTVETGLTHNLYLISNGSTGDVFVTAGRQFDITTNGYYSGMPSTFNTDGDLRVYRRIYPGDQLSQTTTVYLSSKIASGSNEKDRQMRVYLSDNDGASQFAVWAVDETSRETTTSHAQVFGIDSLGRMNLPGSDTAAVGTAAGRLPVVWNGNVYYLALYNA